MMNFGKLVWFIGFFHICWTVVVNSQEHSSIDKVPEYKWLEPGTTYAGLGSGFDIYCQESKEKSIIHIWRSAYLQFVRAPQDYKIYSGENASDVYTKYSSETIWHPNTWISWKDDSVDFPIFTQYCVGIKTTENYSIQLVTRSINYWKVLQLLVGVVLFLSSPSLSRNLAFHYASGMSLGMLASILILLYVMTKFIPKKGASYAVIIFGYSMVMYFLQQFFHRLPDLLVNYTGVLLGYMFISAFISFIVCYRLGPVKDKRTFSIIQWTLQGVSLLFVFFSSEYREVSTVLIIILLSYYFMPSWLTTRVSAVWYYYYPPKLKLLSETEYIEQGNRETKKAIEELRKFCSSPECKAWSTISRLKSPKRFASFVEGDSHLSDDEMMLYDSESPDVDDICLTDDEEDGGLVNHSRNRL